MTSFLSLSCEVGEVVLPASSEVTRVVFGSCVATATSASASAAKLCVVVVVCPITASAGMSLSGRAPASLFPGRQARVLVDSGLPPNLPVLTVLWLFHPAPHRCWLLSPGAEGWALWGPGTSLPPNSEACLIFLVAPPPGT